MNFSSFLKLIEIQTKVASIIPFLFGSLYVYYRYHVFSIKNAVIMFISMIIFDMTTTMINNYMDYKQAIKKEGYGYEIHNPIVGDQLAPKQIKRLIIFMLCLSGCFGLLLVSQTNAFVLFLGIICFIIGIGYSFGPLPISRTPFGEIFSGITMGLILTFISMYIHIYDQEFIRFHHESTHIELFMNVSQLLVLVIVSIPLIMGISNIMLANNICDMDDDLINQRYTLPICIGKERALLLFFALYIFGYFSIIFGVMIGVLPFVSLVTLVTLKPVLHHIKQFVDAPSKQHTFSLSVKIFILINVVYLSSILIAIII
ncbi:1,4-dihydroxy-2-naphthoate polyprenyltransferase [Turicibacter sanguinis]|uniref:1,4-dihydroxy-2-naphthoate polyprenyltransferase n=1 Tax=Turicibacter sanguinis TaxID=154288 RepID=A0A9X4XDE7_9FIRM|nr:1,4-dihydroxy-2-naphthoate polyprenyltransferase [Turicibacter sanguinis]MTK21236.1 1,4-dihydroxy-2-naphthoate polyprenyltransferase [Turicibacter sanguinis]MTK69273.1 1,4-dihydroxy-2-naphthoate polyprenyltransferase [Turicibacter sanguinis]MTK71741.1 1,4-dihydroxy-2-naphthoate polyprenyltransferase [Turicibacter sanguinis]MTK81653.1 1,4-dihydroxy-2-naphthoate polyprenyltransferase [Turicibacter sanguinis]MTK84545.1 1,4-dihydroxy-2-naphthoate polyprenyltransferase [Turicibacter sanguinis]